MADGWLKAQRWRGGGGWGGPWAHAWMWSRNTEENILNVCWGISDEKEVRGGLRIGGVKNTKTRTSYEKTSENPRNIIGNSLENLS